MSHNYNKKPYLRSYDLIRQIRNFFSKINEVAENYEYIVALESRCFNIAKRFLPQVKNLITGSGLLVQHEQLAQYYNSHGYFPKILIIEDALINGSTMSKFLYRLECLLEKDLVKINHQEDRSFRYYLVQAVDIRAYAKHEKIIFLEERYANRLQYVMLLPFAQMYDLSMQLSDSLTRWGIANTIFSYSIQNKTLTEYLCYGNGEVPGWKRILCDCEDEEMLIYIRFDSQTKINIVSTIRIYPGRSSEKDPQLTSLTLTNNIKADTFSKICVELKEIFSRTNSDFSALQKLLNDNSTAIQEIKAQLVYFLLSVIDYHDFRSSVKSKLSQVEIESETDDIEKIACNFTSNAIQTELYEICTSKELLAQIKEMLYKILSLENVSMMCGEISDDFDYDQTRVANATVKEIFYVVAMKAGKEVKYMSEHLTLYHHERFQAYDGNRRKGDVISFNDFNEIASQEHKNVLRNAYCRIASFVNAIDQGIVKLTFQFSQKYNYLYVLCVAE